MNSAQRTFAGGELTPELYARTDLQKYTTALRTCRNFLVQRHGGVANRPGTGFCGSTKNDAPVQLLPFSFSVSGAQQSYVLEFGDSYIRFWQSGALVAVDPNSLPPWGTGLFYVAGNLVTDAGVVYVCTVDHGSNAGNEPGVGTTWRNDWKSLGSGTLEVTTPYAVADVAALQISQTHDVLTITHPNYPVMELRRYAALDWRIAVPSFGPPIAAPTNLSASGGTTGAPQWWAVTAISADTGEESLVAVVNLASGHLPTAANPVTLAWDPVAGAAGYNVYRSTDSATYGYLGLAGGITVPASVTSWAPASVNVATTSAGAWVVGSTADVATAFSARASKPTDGKFGVDATLQLQVTGGTGGLSQARVGAYYSRDGETRQFAGYIDTIVIPTGLGTYTATLAGASFEVPDNGYAALVISLIPEVYGSGNGSTCTATVTPTALHWRENATGYTDIGAAPNFGIVPAFNPTLFASAGRYPATVTNYQQRRIFAGATLDPEQVRASRTGSPSSFTQSTPTQDDDAIAFRLSGHTVNPVRHLLDLGVLLLFTDVGEWSAEGDQSGALLPTAINLQQRTYNGCHPTIRPVVVDSVPLYIQARANGVRDIRRNSVTWTMEGNDLSIYAAHLFEFTTLLGWAYAKVPHSIVWAVRSDGVLLGLTYLREQDVWGWHRHDTDGFFENVCVIPEGNEDRVYVVVRRVINGVTRRYVERFTARAQQDIRDAVFMDAALTFDGRNTSAATMTISGGTTWANGEALTLTASTPTFVSQDIGRHFQFTAADGTTVRLLVQSLPDSSHATVTPVDAPVPVELRGVATTVWARTATSVSGLSHLEGKAVSVLGDGYVLSSPNNTSPSGPASVLTVTGGALTFSQPYAVIQAGLPYIADLETLDLDTASGPSLKEHAMLINRVGFFLKGTRGVWAGRHLPTGTDPLDALEELRYRQNEDYARPTDLVTDSVIVPAESSWDNNGRVCLRQVDPLPVAVLSVTPMGVETPIT